jgi:hypothetical protein
MKNITELRTQLAQVFNDLRTGDVEVKTASELNNCAGKIINSLKVELEYNAMTDKNRKIKFLDS